MSKNLSFKGAQILLILVLAISLLGMAPDHASAQVGTTYYVKNGPGCTDSGSGTLAQPYCTIQKAATVATAGATVRVMAGTYAESVYPVNSGTAANPITYKADPGVVITRPEPAAGNGFGITGLSYIVIDGFVFNNTYLQSIFVVNSNNITIKNNEVKNAGTGNGSTMHMQGIYLKSTTNSLIQGNETHHNSCTGIRLVDSDYNVVIGNKSYANASWIADANVVVSDAAGIDINGSSHNIIQYNITYGNEDSGINIYEWQPSDKPYVPSTYNTTVGNLSYGNGDHGIDHNNSPYNKVIANTVHGNGTVGINFEGTSVATGSHSATVINNIIANNGYTPPDGSHGGALRFDAVSTAGSVADYNLYWRGAPSTFEYIKWNDTNYPSLEAFQGASGMEANGKEGDPLFIAPLQPVLRDFDRTISFLGSEDTGDYHLAPHSPAIDSADSNAPSQPDVDLFGQSRFDDPMTVNKGAGVRTYDDRGAIEYKPLEAIPVTQTFIAPGDGTWTAPADVTSVTVEVWGGGGKGASITTGSGESAGGGGGGGAYARKAEIPVVPGQTYTYRVGAGATGTGAGGDSYFINNTTVLAKGGASASDNSAAGGDGGPADSSIGDVKFSGGSGADGRGQSNRGGGGGSSAGTGAKGVDASNANGATAPSGGGNGGDAATSTVALPEAGFIPGGGGGGAYRATGNTTHSGGSGANGQVRITYNSVYQPMVSTTTLNCSAGTPVVTYGAAINCVATVTTASGSVSPTGIVTWTSDSTGTFSTGTCTLTGTGGSATCSVSYTPGMVGDGTHQLTATYLETGNFRSSSANQTITVNKALASVTPNVATKVYGDPDPVFTGTLTGFLPADAAVLTPLTTYSRVAGETMLGGPYTITGTIAANPVLDNYTVTYNTAKFTITPRSASVTPNDASKMVGDLDPELGGVLTGFLPADNVKAAYKRIAGEAPGTYTISAVLSPEDVLSNYNITYNTGTFTIKGGLKVFLPLTVR